MEPLTFLVNFEGDSARDASILAAELKRFLQNSSESIHVEQRREDPHTMDLGATLTIILSSGAVVAFAEGLASWLRQRSKASIEIRKQTKVDGSVKTEVVAKGVTHRTVQQLAAQFTSKM